MKLSALLLAMCAILGMNVNANARGTQQRRTIPENTRLRAAQQRAAQNKSVTTQSVKSRCEAASGYGWVYDEALDLCKIKFDVYDDETLAASQYMAPTTLECSGSASYCMVGSTRLEPCTSVAFSNDNYVPTATSQVSGCTAAARSASSSTTSQTIEEEPDNKAKIAGLVSGLVVGGGGIFLRKALAKNEEDKKITSADVISAVATGGAAGLIGYTAGAQTGDSKTAILGGGIAGLGTGVLAGPSISKGIETILPITPKVEKK